MSGPRTCEELELIVRSELTHVGLVAEQLRVHLDEFTVWCIDIEIGGRKFSLGFVQRDGFFCAEMTEGRKIDFTSYVDQPIFGHPDRLRLNALKLVRYVVDHPEFRGIDRPVI